MDTVTQEFMDRIQELQQEHGQMPKNFIQELYKWALESVGLIALNRRLGCLDKNLSPDSEPMILIEQANKMLEALTNVEMSAGTWRWLPNKHYKMVEKSHAIFQQVANANILETKARIGARRESE